MYDPTEWRHFLMEQLLYLAPAEREAYAGLGRREGDQDEVCKLARATWPCRRALSCYAETWPEREWQAVLDNVWPTTAILLKRLRTKTGARTLDEVLRGELAVFAFHALEAQEIPLVRQEVYLTWWHEESVSLEPFFVAAQQELANFEQQLTTWRTEAEELSAPARAARLAEVRAQEVEFYFLTRPYNPVQVSCCRRSTIRA